MNVLDRLSFQLYSARKFPPLNAQLAALAGMGFLNVEPYGALLAEHDALKTGLERNRLRAPSSHVSLDRLLTDPDGVARQVQELGITLLIVPAVPPKHRPSDAEGWRRLGRSLAEIQEKLPPGLALAWHNHDFEFRRLADGSAPLDRMFEVAPKLLWEADIGWLHVAGEDPVVWLMKYRDRIKAVHIKDVAPAGEKANEDGWADIGDGVIDWKRLMPALEAADPDLFVLEHDNPADYEGFARRSRAAMATW